MALFSNESSATITGKRKRPVINYATLGQACITDIEFEDYIEGDAPMDSDSDNEGEGDIPDGDSVYGSRKKATKPKRASKKRARLPPPKSKKEQKPFPFLRLPPELRDYIYELALVDPNGMRICFKAKAARRTITRAINYPSPEYYRGDAIDDSDVPQKAQLVPNLLVTNKQIYAEAIGYLYKQAFIVDDVMALHTFIATISPLNRLQLSTIVLQSWGEGRGVYKAMNFASLTLLAACTNLKELKFDCSIVWDRNPKRTARHVYRNGHFFLEAFSMANGKDAAVKVLNFGSESFGRSGYSIANTEDEREKLDEEFRDELKALLKC